ncbi:MAG: hypothetical protein V7K50_26435 [Nostoc sp.]|uniref:hypothetical protein n=1 Tax=Nostoc sp. TaxID=1180 RepID=UPI002FF5BCC8
MVASVAAARLELGTGDWGLGIGDWEDLDGDSDSNQNNQGISSQSPFLHNLLRRSWAILAQPVELQEYRM